jgi:hypothetical protein
MLLLDKLLLQLLYEQEFFVAALVDVMITVK